MRDTNFKDFFDVDYNITSKQDFIYELRDLIREKICRSKFRDLTCTTLACNRNHSGTDLDELNLKYK